MNDQERKSAIYSVSVLAKPVQLFRKEGGNSAVPSLLELLTWSSNISAALCLCFLGGGILGFRLVRREKPHADNVLKVNEIK